MCGRSAQLAQEGNKPRLQLGATRHDRLENDQEGCAAAIDSLRSLFCQFYTATCPPTGQKIFLLRGLLASRHRSYTFLLSTAISTAFSFNLSHRYLLETEISRDRLHTRPSTFLFTLSLPGSFLWPERANAFSIRRVVSRVDKYL